MNTCKADGCNTIVADPNQEFCRGCRAKLASAAQELKFAGARVEESSGKVTVDSSSSYDDIEGEDLADIIGDIDAISPFPKGPIVPVYRNGVSKAEQGYLPFPCMKNPGPADWTIQAQPQALFKGTALMLWGFDDSTVIRAIYIGQYIQGAVSMGDIPASFFGTAKSYEKLIEDFAKNGISPPNWITWKVCNLGNVITISGRGPLSHAVMLGKVAY
jgi:hypothetical protein